MNSSLETIYVPAESYSAYVSAFSSYVNNAKIIATGTDEDFTVVDGTLTLYNGEGGDVTIPAGVERIGQSAFQNCKTLTSVTFNDELVGVDSYAFKGCTALKNVVFNDALETIGNRAFYGCTSLTNVKFAAGMNTVGEYAFGGCTGIKGDLVIPSSVVNIGNGAFSGCTGLNGKLTIEGNEESTTIGSKAFYGCSGITGLELGEGITSIGDNAFDYCKGIKGDLVIPNTVTSLGSNAFNNCYGLNGKLTLSEALKTIPYSCFYNCEFTGELVIPDSVEEIYYEAFRNCTGITSIVFGEGLKAIEEYAFRSDNSVKEITFKGNNVPNGDFLSYMNSSLETIYVPAESYSAYVSAFERYANGAEFSTDTLKSNVKSLTANRYSRSIKLSWSAHMNDSVENYVILRNGEQIATTTDLFYVDRNLEKGTYTYFVYGLTSENEQTGVATITTSTAEPELTKIYTNHIGNSIGISDGKIYISAKNTNGYVDLDGNEIIGVLYYLVNGKKEIAGESKISVGSTTSSNIVYVVNWNVENIETREYDVEFVLRDIDGTEAKISGKINVDKSVPEKIINVIAVGDYSWINLSWSQSNEVDSTTYKVYRKSEVDKKFTLLKTISGRTNLTYKDTNVKEDRKYSYYVTTVNSFGTESEPSDIAIAMRAKDTEAPTVTKFTPSSKTIITGTQRIVVNAVDNLMVTSAKLYYSLDSGETWQFISECKSSPFTFDFDTTGLDGDVVKLKATAFDAQGNESAPMFCEYTVDNVGPDKVTGLSAKEIHTSQLTLQWNDVSANDAACFILQQKIGNDYETIARSITTLGYNIFNLRPSTKYTYRVAAIDIRGNIGEYSDDFTVTTAKDTIAPVVTSLAPNPGRHNNSISFKATAGDDCGVKSISIQVSTDRKNWTTVSTAEFATYNKTATYAYTISLDKYSDCSLYVRAFATDFSDNISDTGDGAGFVEYYVDKSAPNKPRDLIASGGDGWIYISWLQGAEEDLETYSLYRSTSEDGSYQLIASNLKQVNYYDTSAQRGTVYYYKLRVIDTTGNISEFSDAVSAKVADDITPPEVINVNPASGSFVGPAYNTIEALVKDNNCIKDIVVEYRINDDEKFKTLEEFKNINYYYATIRTNLPISELKDGDKIFIRVYATDICGMTSEYSCEYTYIVDKVAPTLSGLKAVIDEDNAKITWNNGKDSDVSGYRIYRMNSDESFTYIGSRSYSSSSSYTFYDYIRGIGDGDYVYKIEAYDKVGNLNSFLTDPIHYVYEEQEHERVNKAPKAVINGFAVMEIGVEEFFDAGYSTDDTGIVSYIWDFGDGTTSNEIKTVKKYMKPGQYTVTLSVVDDDGVKTTETMLVTVNERTAVGTVRVNVVDENGKAVPNAPVYYNLGTDEQKVVYADSNGAASMLLEKGEHEIGVYKSGYLPVQKNVTVLPNATRVITATIIEQEIVTGEFEVTRMTFSEIQAAGIDVYSPANQNVYKVNATIKFGSSEVPVTYIRNESKIISYTVDDSGGTKQEAKKEVLSESKEERKIGSITFVPNEADAEVIAVLDIPASASYTKEFFDTKLHIINNAASQFELIENKVHLNVPDGMTLMNNLNGNYSETVDVEFESLKGQETKTLNWILRGDKEGEYNLQADYSGVLKKFNASVKATFKTDDPIKVYGFSSLKFIVEVDKEIRNNALYFNFGLENISTIDIYNPVLDFDGLVNNITSSTKQKAEGIDGESNGDFSTESVLLNVRVKYHDGTSQYIPYTRQNDGKVLIDVDTLSPGDSVYYEYVSYNAINYDGIAYFMDASKEVLSGYSQNVEIKPVSMSLYNTSNSKERMQNLNETALSFILNDSNYYYWNEATKTKENSIGRFLNNCGQLIFNFNWDVLTGEDREKLAESILLKLLTDQNALDNVDDLITTDCISAVKSYLSLVKSEISDRTLDYDDFFKETVRERLDYYEESGIISINGDTVIYNNKEYTYSKFKDYIFEEGKYNLYQAGEIINGFLGNYQTLDSLAKVLQQEGPEGLNETIKAEVAKIIGAASLTAINWEIKDFLNENEVLSELSKSCKYVSKILDYGIMNPIKAINEANYKQSIYNAIQTNACIQEEAYILDVIIDYLGKNDVDSKSAEAILKVAKEYKKIVEGNAFKFAEEVYANYLKLTAGSLSKDAAKALTGKMLGKFSGKATIIYALLGATYNILDSKLKFSEKYKCEDGLDIAECLSTAFENYWLISKSDYDESPDNIEASVKAIHALKYLIQTRLIGEAQFKQFIQNVETGFIEEYNKHFNPKYKDVEDMYDDIYQSILEARDLLFNIEETTSVVKPAAPEVSFNYATNSTDQSFDSGYEYCLSDGEWKSCDGRTITVKPTTHAITLRVRKASGIGTVAGEITTVTIKAQREISKVISVKFDNNTYSFSNLVTMYDYQVSFIDEDNVVPSWDNVMTIHGSTEATIHSSFHKYIAIRTCGNEKLRETVSQYRILEVQTKQKLIVNTWGDGVVEQSNADGTYFVGESITLKAKSLSGSKFAGWFIDGESVGREDQYILEMSNNAEITAKFEGGTSTSATGMNISLVQPNMQENISQAKRKFATRAEADSFIPDITIYSGTSAKLTAGVYPENAENKYVLWSSSDSSIATVDSNGNIIFIKSGNVVITATLENGIKSEYKIKVLNNNVEKIVITNPVSKTLYTDDEMLDLSGLKVAATYSDGSIKEITGYTVGGYDRSVGKHTITVSYSGEQAEFTVEVTHNCGYLLTKEATCSEEGEYSFVCKYCGAVTSTQKVEKLQHNYELKTTTPATKDKNGIKSMVCTVCGDIGNSIEYEWCDHNLSSTVIAPTCENGGYTKYICSKCGEIIIDDETDALGHDYKKTIVEPSCGKTGYTLNKCTSCGDQFISDKKDALKHNYVTSSVSATCSSEGGTVHECSICGDSFITDTIPKKSHSYSAITVSATCETGGYTEYTCLTCGDSYKADETPALGHKLSEKKISGDCEKGSYTLHKCLSCDYSYKTDIVEPRAHQFGEWIVCTASSESRAGEKYRVCILCGKEETKAIPVTDHAHAAGDWFTVKEPTCTEYGVKARKCTECNEIIETEKLNASGHSLNNKVVKATCTEDGYTLHSCSKCEYSYKTDVIKASGHDVSNWIYTENPTCTDEGKREKVCNSCGTVIEEETVDAPGHNESEWIVTSEPNCTEPGYQVKVCLTCGEKIAEEAIKPIGHKYSSVTTSPTCTEQGFTKYTCSVCGDCYTSDNVPAKGHTDGKWKITKQPTTKAEGERKLYCKDCGKVIKTESIPKLEPTGKVNSVKIDDITLNYKASATITPTIKVDDGVKYTVKYSSSNIKVATVDKYGKVYAAKRGTATITCTVTDSDGNTVQDTCKVTVKYTWWQWIIKIVLGGWAWYSL